MSTGASPDDLLELLEKAEKDADGLPPVHRWEPERQLDIDMRIARDGTWYYQNSPIRRRKMVNLFSTVLRRDGDRYYLVTPVEKLGIQVDDAPFVAVDVEVVNPGPEQKLVFATNVDRHVVAGPEHPIEVRVDEASGEPSPYVKVRDNLWALIGRTVFYRLVDMACPDDNSQELVVRSHGETFALGRY
jgi:hypothetical protein